MTCNLGLVEGLGVGLIEDRSGGYEHIAHVAAGGFAEPDLYARRIKAALSREVLAGVEGTLSGGFGFLVGGCVADHDELRVGLLCKRQGDAVQAGLGFIVHAHRAAAVALKADAAERLSLSDRGYHRRQA